MNKFTVNWGDKVFVIQAHDWQPDEGGISFMDGPLEENSAEIIAFFSHPVAVILQRDEEEKPSDEHAR